jgi:hypothetical protein
VPPLLHAQTNARVLVAAIRVTRRNAARVDRAASFPDVAVRINLCTRGDVSASEAGKRED